MKRTIIMLCTTRVWGTKKTMSTVLHLLNAIKTSKMDNLSGPVILVLVHRSSASIHLGYIAYF